MFVLRLGLSLSCFQCIIYYFKCFCWTRRTRPAADGTLNALDNAYESCRSSVKQYVQLTVANTVSSVWRLPQSLCLRNQSNDSFFPTTQFQVQWIHWFEKAFFPLNSSMKIKTSELDTRRYRIIFQQSSNWAHYTNVEMFEFTSG